MIAIKYAVTLLDHMYATVTLAMNWDWMIELVLVRTKYFRFYCSNFYFKDTNECNEYNGGCAQNCSNTVGSYVCSCRTGYTLDTDNHACNGEHNFLKSLLFCYLHIIIFIDINECASGTNDCEHSCFNTVGSYVCDCIVGYVLDTDGSTCTG